jgi:LysM repeat protein
MKKQARTPLFSAPQLKPRRTAPPKAGFWMRAVTRRGANRQRAEPFPLAGDGGTDTRTRVVRGAVIIFGAHILAIMLYFVHLNFLGGKTDDSTTATRTEPQLAPPPGDEAPRMEIISSGDTWATIAVRTGVDEARLREVNKGRPFENGRALIIPDENAGAAPPPSSSEARLPHGAADGLVDVIPEVLDPADGDHASPLAEPVAPRAVVVADPAVRASGRTHKVKSGETLWRISSRYKVDQRKLMELNGIKDPNKLAAGATLKIPE